MCKRKISAIAMTTSFITNFLLAKNFKSNGANLVNKGHRATVQTKLHELQHFYYRTTPLSCPLLAFFSYIYFYNCYNWLAQYSQAIVWPFGRKMVIIIPFEIESQKTDVITLPQPDAINYAFFREGKLVFPLFDCSFITGTKCWIHISYNVTYFLKKLGGFFLKYSIEI